MRLLIADDERLVRYHIRCLVEEEDPSITVLEAENGKELVDLVASGRTDAALVDIRMPKLDGLQALRELTGKARQIPWAVLSSHSEFEYAQRALELGALAYTLKPPSAEEIGALVGKLRAAFERSLESRAHAFEREWARLAYEGGAALPSAAEGSLFGAALLISDGACTEAASRARLTAVTRIVMERARRHAEEGLLAAVLSRPELPALEIACCAESACGEPDADAMRRFWNEIASAAAAEPSGYDRDDAIRPSPATGEDGPASRSVRVFLAVTESAEDPTEARGGLDSALAVLERRALLPAGAHPVHAAQQLLVSFGAADQEAAAAVSRALTAAATRNRAALREAAAAYAAAVKAGITERALEAIDHFLGRTLPDAAGTDDPIAACAKALEDQEGSAEGRRAEGDTITAVEEFVRRRFAEGLSLAETARIFGLTPNYLSALFHRRVGMTFVEYATELRLSRARELLRAGKSVKEAAWAVGYGSERHFARLYRDRFGGPPGDEKRPKTPPQD